jgi:hypothetical protein
MIIDAAINLELNKTDVYDTYRSGHDLDVFVKVSLSSLLPLSYH